MQIEETCSSVRNSKTGVPQGSILGPLLLIIYVNDINKASSKFEAILYADDTSLNSIIKVFGNNDTSEMINHELLQVHEWLRANKLSLNISKTKYMMFRFPQKRSNTLPVLDINIEGNRIERVTTFDFLGVTINETLTWRDHIQKLSCKISRVIGILSRCKKFLHTSVLVKIYNALILSRINYGILCWGYENKRIYKLQKQALRLICKKNYIAHTDPLFSKLKTLKVKDIYVRQSLKFFYSLKNDKIPSYFENFHIGRNVTHNYNTRQRNQFRNVSRNRVSCEKVLRYLLPKLLLNIPNSIKESIHTHSVQSIKNRFKLYALGTYNDTCSIRNCFVCEHTAS